MAPRTPVSGVDWADEAVFGSSGVLTVFVNWPRWRLLFFFKIGFLIELQKVTEISKLCSISDMLRAADHAGVTVCNRHRESFVD